MATGPPYPIPPGRIHPFTHSALYVSYTAARGRGVYTSQALAAGTIVEIGLLLYFRPAEIQGNALSEYTYRTTLTRTVPVAAGLGQGKVSSSQASLHAETQAGSVGVRPAVSEERRVTERMEALALGLGSLFNHGGSSSSTGAAAAAAADHARDAELGNRTNLTYRINGRQGTITYTTCRPVEADEELCIWYGDDVSWMTLHDRDAGTSTDAGTAQSRHRRASSADAAFADKLLSIEI